MRGRGREGKQGRDQQDCGTDMDMDGDVDMDMVSELLSVRRSPFCRDLA